MNTKLYGFLILLSCLISTQFFGQEILSNGEKQIVDSKILNEKREILIHLPKSYHDQNIKPAKYPVIYLLDAETNFDYYAGMVDLLSKQPYAEIPEMIIVGIKNTDRTRDLTTSKSLEKNSVNPNELQYKNSGGSKDFSQFIEDELKPFILSKYRIDQYSVLVGHSFGGLFAVDVLFKNTKNFNAYVINDPSLWWNNEKPMQLINNFFENGKKLPEGTFVFLAQANNEGHSTKSIEEMTLNIKKFKNILSENHPQYFQHRFYQEDGHGTVIYPANFDALKYLFKGYRTNVKEFAKDPTILMDFYTAFSKKQHFQFKPSESYLNFIINYLKKNNFQESAEKVLEIKKSIYK